MRFGDVILENAEIGHTYSMREALRIPLGVENRSDIEAEVLVELYPAPQSKLSKNYEAIPDPSWLKALPERMTIGPRSQGFFDLLLTIPNDAQLVGRHFQAMIRGRLVGTGLLAVSVTNSIRFSIGPGPETLEEEKRQLAMQQLDFDISPQLIYLSKVPLGVKFNATKEQKKTIRVANYAEEELAIEMNSTDWDGRLHMPEGYEVIPSTAWVKFDKKKVEVEGGAIKPVEIVVEIPKDERYKGKKYAALVKSQLAEGFWLDAPVRIFISTEE